MTVDAKASGAEASGADAALRLCLRSRWDAAALPAVRAVLRPAGIADWTTSLGLVVLAALVGLATAATLVARRRPPETGASQP